MAKCKSTIKFLDDTGNKECSFHCQLQEKHEGDHKAMGNTIIFARHKYVVTWTDDATIPYLNPNTKKLENL